MLLSYRYGGKQGKAYKLRTSKHMLVLRSHDFHLPSETNLSAKAQRALHRLDVVMEVPHAGVQVFGARRGNAALVN